MALLTRHAAAESAASPARGFSADERRLLLSLPRIGPTVLARIEEQGIASLRDLQCRGVEHVVDEVCRRMHTRAWANRRSALARALDTLVCPAAAPGPAPEAGAGPVQRLSPGEPRLRRGRTAA